MFSQDFGLATIVAVGKNCGQWSVSQKAGRLHVRDEPIVFEDLEFRPAEMFQKEI